MEKTIDRTSSFRGIITPMITPTTKQGEIDKERLERLINHLVNGGVHGIFILGTTGESASLSYRQKYDLIKTTGNLIQGRTRFFVGITDSSLEESITLASEAEKNGADAVVSAPPYYFGLNQEELTSYFQELAGKSPLPLFLYNIPSQTKISIEPETVKKLATHSNIYGIKDSSSNAPYFNTILHQLKEDFNFSVFVGPDEMMAQSVLMGGNGGVNSGSNLFPELFVELYKAASEGDLARVSILQDIVIKMSSLIYQIGKTGASFLKGLKMAMSFAGLCEEFMLPPLMPFKDAQKEKIKQNLALLNEIISSNGKNESDI